MLLFFIPHTIVMNTNRIKKEYSISIFFMSLYAKLISEKKAAYTEYHRVRNEMKELLTVKANVDLILGVESEETKREKV